jgi:hypothetical protein
VLLLLAGKVDAHGAVTAVALSSDHTPMDAKEAERIIATGVSRLAVELASLYLLTHLVATSSLGIICVAAGSFHCRSIHTQGQLLKILNLLTCLPHSLALQGRIASFMCGDEPLGPPRVWLRAVNIPGLCMTRSFGDYVAASVGVIDQPQLMAATLKPEDK